MVAKLKAKDFVAIEEVRIDGGTQPRGETNLDYVAQLAEQLDAGNELPDVDVFHDGDDHWLADGFHRYHAHVKAGVVHINAKVHQGTKEDAQWFSYAANKLHDVSGLRRTNADKQRAVEAALRHPNSLKMSDRAIADYVGVNHSTVTRHRPTVAMQQSDNSLRTGRDGRTINTANIGKTPPARTFPTYSPAPQPTSEPTPKPTVAVVARDTGEVLDDVDIVTTTTKRPTPETRREEFPLPDGPTPEEEARSSPGVRWSRNMHECWVILNSIRDLGGIEKLTAKWSLAERENYIVELTQFRDAADEWIQTLEKSCTTKKKTA